MLSFWGYPSYTKASTGRHPIVLKNFQICFSFFIEGNKEFSPLQPVAPKHFFEILDLQTVQ
ncbi:hypothetical protein COY07_04950 [Candidatus Peregrinibacteria bacterium CG_4_10_14_0_2_um_filter_43_11]|nr:MAG: hypothetical protein COY07_04950 [Candidatus Peregrinibacteria bacterium CG_4_10_14_0_2_um_filter_43_11]